MLVLANQTETLPWPQIDVVLWWGDCWLDLAVCLPTPPSYQGRRLHCNLIASSLTKT